ncbi:SCO family protein [Algiphilus sp.]|uniref:SCO family protein n=1 Tax=Algiphilus sp. TaxID=1872431 RepID=UPI003B52A4C5
MPRPSLFTVGAVSALLVGLAVALFTLRPSSGGQLEGGILLSQPRAISPFSLVDASGEAFTETALQGRWTAIFPGFTHCPDICPTTLGVLRDVMNKLEGPKREQWQIVFLTVDPSRDTPEALSQYVGYFSDAFIGVTGDMDEIDGLTKDLSIAYRYTPQEDGGYTVDHTAAIVLVNPQGQVAGYLQPPYQPARMAADLRTTLGTS